MNSLRLPTWVYTLELLWLQLAFFLPVEDLWKVYLSVLLNLAAMTRPVDLKPMPMFLLFRVGIRECQKFELEKILIAHVSNDSWTNLLLYDDSSTSMTITWCYAALNLHIFIFIDSYIYIHSCHALCPTILDNLDTSFTSPLLWLFSPKTVKSNLIPV